MATREEVQDLFKANNNVMVGNPLSGVGQEVHGSKYSPTVYIFNEDEQVIYRFYLDRQGKKEGMVIYGLAMDEVESTFGEKSVRDLFMTPEEAGVDGGFFRDFAAKFIKDGPSGPIAHEYVSLEEEINKAELNFIRQQFKENDGILIATTHQGKHNSKEICFYDEVRDRVYLISFSQSKGGDGFLRIGDCSMAQDIGGMLEIGSLSEFSALETSGIKEELLPKIREFKKQYVADPASCSTHEYGVGWKAKDSAIQEAMMSALRELNPPHKCIALRWIDQLTGMCRSKPPVERGSGS